jgi:hypothetical protein
VHNYHDYASRSGEGEKGSLETWHVKNLVHCEQTFSQVALYAQQSRRDG